MARDLRSPCRDGERRGCAPRLLLLGDGSWAGGTAREVERQAQGQAGVAAVLCPVCNAQARLSVTIS